MNTPSTVQRLAIAARGYAVAAIFGLVFLVLRLIEPSLSTTALLALAAVTATPLALALFWEFIKGFKIGQLEVKLADIALPVDDRLGIALQELRGSATPELVHTITAAIERQDLRLVQVNLQSKPYWWSTRLFLLSALADEYTNIERLVFVDGDSALNYLGMAEPSAVRRALARRFPDYKQKFHDLHNTAQMGAASKQEQIEIIGYQWSASFPIPEEEEQTKVFVTKTELSEWLGYALNTDARDWDGETASNALYARIITCETHYVPLLRGRRLEKVVDAEELARCIAESALT